MPCFELNVALYDNEPFVDPGIVEEKEVAAVLDIGRGELGLRRGADEEGDDKPKRAKSRLNVDSRLRGGNGDDVFLRGT